MRCRGIRGATTVEENTKEAITEATRELLQLMVESNAIDVEQVAAATFTTTPDLNAEYPAVAARQIGWYDSALLCSHEMGVPDGLPMCIRILLLVNTEMSGKEIKHIYIKDAKNLRPQRDAADGGVGSPMKSYNCQTGEN